MKKILGVLVLVLLGIAFSGMQAVADEGAYCPGMKMGQGYGMGNKIDFGKKLLYKAGFIIENADDLGISDEQLQKIRALKMDVKKTLIKNGADLELLVLDIEAELIKDEINVESISALIDKKYGIKSQEAKSLVSAYAELKKIITKDQMKKLRELLDKQKMEDKDQMMEAKEDRMRKMKMR